MINYYEKIIKQAIIILLICLPVLFNPFGFEVFALPRMVFLYLIILFIVLLLILSLNNKNNVSVIYSKTILFLIPFIFFVFTSYFFSLDKQIAFWGYTGTYEGIFSWLSYFFMFYIGFLFFRDEKKLKQLFFVLSFVVGIVGLYAVTEYFGIWQFMEWSQKTEIKRAVSFLGHPIYLGTYFVLLLPLIFSLLISDGLNKNKKIILSTNIALGIVGLILSFSRGAWVAIFMICFICFILNFKTIKQKTSNFIKNKLKFFWFFLVLFFLMTISIWLNELGLLVIYRVRSIFDFSSSSTLVRGLLYHQSWLLLQDNWLVGIGPDNFVYAMPKYALNGWNIFKQTTAEKAHNLFLDIWISFGIGGLVSFLLFLFCWLRNSIIFIKKINIDNTIFQGIYYSVIGCLIAWQFHYSTIDLAPIFWFLLGIGAGLMVKGGIEKEKNKIFLNSRHVNLFKASLIICFGFVFIFFINFSYKKISADYFFAQALKSKNIGQGINYIEKAIYQNNSVGNYYLVANSFYLKTVDSEQYKKYLQQSLDGLIYASYRLPLDYRITYQLGETYLIIANFAQNKESLYLQAEKAYTKTLDLYPKHIEANLKLGVVSAMLNKNEEAIKYWTKCLEINKYFNQCNYNLAILYQKLEMHEKSEYYFKEFDKYK